MSQLNKISLQGRLTADPELRYTQNNVAMCSFSIANDTGTKDSPKANFFNCVAWRGLAEVVSKYFVKGSPIILNGRIEQDNFTDKSGNKRTAYKLIVDEAYFCGDKPQNNPAVGLIGKFTTDLPSEPKTPSTRQIEPDGYFPMNADEFVPF